MKKLRYLLLSICLLGCSGMISQSNELTREWKYSDLRYLDPSDIANPNLDLIAFYTRDLGKSIEIRLDFLYMDPIAPAGILIAFDHGYLGDHHLLNNQGLQESWNQLLIVFPDGRAVIKNKNDDINNNFRISIIRDSTLDALILRINKQLLIDYSIKTKVFVYSFGNDNTPTDELCPFLLNGSPPDPIKMVVAFWNTFQSNTPSQVLRSWNGAHTGPFSTRHGLKALLKAAETTSVPIHLVDLDTKGNISTLDYLNVLSQIRTLEDRGLIHLNRIDKTVFFTEPYKVLSTETSIPASENYPMMELRKKMIETRQNEILVLGGDFSLSPLGNDEYAFQMLSYIRNHPWLKMVTPAIRNPTQTNAAISEEGIPTSILFRINALPNSQLKQIIQRLLTTYHTEENSQKKELWSNYLGFIGHLLAVEKWSENPREIEDCDHDLDWDRIPECLLATKNTVSVIELQGGYISVAFALHSGEFHQLIGPSFQLMAGLSDPVTWDFSQGMGSDPKIIPGAFSTLSNKWIKYTPHVTAPGTIMLLNKEMGIQKTITALDNGFEFHYKGIESNQFLFPILLDPWIMDDRNWGDMYKNEFKSNNWKWEIKDQIAINLTASDQMDILTFIDSRKYLAMPEQPSFSYPEGHFLPFPLALAKISTNDEGIIKLYISY